MTKPEQDISYALPPGGLPAQSQRLADRAVFTTAYAFIPKTVMTDIVTSALPFWEQTRLWVLARPLSGFAETFSHYLMEVGPNGGQQHEKVVPQSHSKTCLNNDRCFIDLGVPFGLQNGARKCT